MKNRNIIWYGFFVLFALWIILGSIFQGEVAKWLTYITLGYLVGAVCISTFHAVKEKKKND